MEMPNLLFFDLPSDSQNIPPVFTIFDVKHASCENPLDNEVFATNIGFPLGGTPSSEVWENSSGDLVATGPILMGVAPGIYTYKAIFTLPLPIPTNITISRDVEGWY